MAEPLVYDIPSAAGGGQGLEGFDVLVGDLRVGRVAALNDTPEGLVLIVDTGDAYRPLPASLLERIEWVGQAVRLSRAAEEALDQAPEIEPRVRPTDTPQLVRHIPTRFQALIVRGERRRKRSRLWLAGAPLIVLGGVGLMAGPVLAAEGVGGSLRWLWIALPLVVFVLGVWAFWVAMSRDSPHRLSAGDKLWEAATAIFGITPPTRRRG